jgi:hypothetical protein
MAIGVFDAGKAPHGRRARRGCGQVSGRCLSTVHAAARHKQQFLARRRLQRDTLRGRHQAQQARKFLAPRGQVEFRVKAPGQVVDRLHVAFHIKQCRTNGLRGFARLRQLHLPGLLACGRKGDKHFGRAKKRHAHHGQQGHHQGLLAPQLRPPGHAHPRRWRRP